MIERSSWGNLASCDLSLMGPSILEFRRFLSQFCLHFVHPKIKTGQFPALSLPAHDLHLSSLLGDLQMFELVVDIFLIVGVLTPLAAYERWREFSHSRGKSNPPPA